jgi:signal transduction histidine kinase
LRLEKIVTSKRYLLLINTPVNHWDSTKKKDERSAFVQEQFIDLFLKQNNRAISAILLSSFLVYLLLLLRIHEAWPPIWIGAVVVISFLRFSFTKRWVKSSRQPISIIIGLMLLNSMIFICPLVSFSRLADIDRAFITVVLIAVATASVAATNGFKGIFLWFSAPLLIPLGLSWAIYSSGANDSPWVRWGIAGLTLLYLIYLMKLGNDQSRVFIDSCSIRYAEQAHNTRLKLALDEAKLATLAKSRFLAAASHDLRQPLHTMGVLLAAIGLRNLDERSREIVQMLSTVSNSLSGQLDGLLDISKLDAGVMTPDLRPHRLDQIIKAHAEQITSTAQDKNLHVRVDCPQSVVVLTDIHLVQRLLSNLTSNALKFTHMGGIDISLRLHDNQAVLDVADSGIGIAREHQELVFQEFYQVSNPERDRTVGLGLGLAIVERICALLSIGIRLVSTPGQGCRFILTMPCIGNELLHAVPAATAKPLNFRQLSVLVVDDEVDVRQGMRLLLEELGCTVALAGDSAQAVACAGQHRFEIIISDFRLRQTETGLDVIQQVRAIQPHIYPLLISGDTAPDRMRQAHETGIAFLHKPVALDALIEHLQNVGSLT